MNKNRGGESLNSGDSTNTLAKDSKNKDSTNIIIKNIDKDFVLTNKKLPTRRGVIWLGQTCNLNCYFCYFKEKIEDKSHPEHPFFTLDKAKAICKIFVDDYGLNSIDIQGGEPTIYPHIFELIRYCNEIGLKPTLITNLISLANFDHAKKFKDAGIYDFLVSLQGIGDTYDKVVGKKNAFDRQMQALENLAKLQIPIRVNAVLSNEIIKDLEAITDIAMKYRARVVNFIGYNNTGDQKILRDTYKIPYYDLIAKRLEPLIDRLESSDIEVNLRFLPFCTISEQYRKNIQNSTQMLYDNHEWEASSRLWIDRPNQRRAKEAIEKRSTIYYLSRYKLHKIYRGNLSEKFAWSKRLLTPFVCPSPRYAPIESYQKPILKKLRFYTPDTRFLPNFSKVEHFYFEQKEVLERLNKSKIHHKKCETCDIKEICDGFAIDFIDEFGANAIRPIKIGGGQIHNPRFYSKDQLKVIERQEWDWFFTQDEIGRIKGD